jgi:thioredoxin reductase (NADPH)
VGGWADGETADAIRTAMALGHIDYYALKPWSTPDELFHRLISEFLQEWRRQNAPGRRELTVVADPWSPRALRAAQPSGSERRAACVPHL